MPAFTAVEKKKPSSVESPKDAGYEKGCLPSISEERTRKTRMVGLLLGAA